MTGRRPAVPPPAAGDAQGDRGFPRTLLAADPLDAARALLGAHLVREPRAAGEERRTGRIVEVEAYLGPEDRASHARAGRTARTGVMFGPPGIAYVYLVYGMHHCLNVVTAPESRASAVLIRAVEPVEGIATMRAARVGSSGRRTVPATPPRPVGDARLAAGPALVAACFGIDRTDTGTDLCDPRSSLRLEPRDTAEAEPVIEAGPRIGIDYAGEPWVSMPWRLVVAGSPSLSRPPSRRRSR